MDLSKYIPPLSPAEWCQLFFVLATSCVLGITVLPSTTQRLLLDYGARSSDSDRERRRQARQAKTTNGSSWAEMVASEVTSWGQIPHSWFTAFYVASLACSAFWVYQYLLDGEALRFVAARQQQRDRQLMEDTHHLSVQSMQRVVTAWTLMTLQGVRRLLEQVFVARTSSSTIWVVHWLLGVAFYLSFSVALWVEGSSSILRQNQQLDSAVDRFPSALTAIAVATFLIGSAAQNWCHKHLAGMTKYSLPNEGLFRHIVCPHYACECLLYLSLAIVAAPDGRLLNRTVLSALAFVTVNLGVTAYGTRKWYEGKFGRDSIARRWTMIPLVY